MSAILEKIPFAIVFSLLVRFCSPNVQWSCRAD
jgi:hypothetical protein